MSKNGKLKGGRNIIDPKDWNRSEVSGIAEGNLQKNKRDGARVTSIRSSLFKKAAESATAGASPKASSKGELEKIFGSPDHASGLDRSLTHCDNTSLQMCAYGKENKAVWPKDIFALVHNGIRSELQDLSACLRAAKNIRENLTLSDFKGLHQWWKDFTAIFLEYGILEDKVLIPWIQRAVDSAGPPDPRASAFIQAVPRRRKTQKSALQAIESRFVSFFGAASIKEPSPNPPSKATDAANLILNMDRVINLIADYMWEQEMQLTAVLASFYKDEKSERDSIISAIVQQIVSPSSSRSKDLLVLQTRWMTDPKISKSHIRTILSVHDCPYSKYVTQFEVSHAGVVAVFKVKGNITA